ncbi:hypothetical protein F5I97DRAFT_1871774 [Phlebopus sp. FC_14]|nr:hypothetical protein F5I97DRAFT_1871774 [Phlebopus sp. FC_14]
MMSAKTKRTSKHTYAERVLGAYSQAQREHRRQSVHIATLRAQVRKMAQARKDKLGPQWTSWVGKAVHRLEEQGFLRPVDSSGYVSMTAEGKKAVNLARRKLFGAAVSHVTTPFEEELLWRNVAEQFSPASHVSALRLSAPPVAGKKRRQSARMRELTEDEEEAEEEPSASRRGTTTKRRRTTGAVSASARQSVTTPQKPLSKMNKAELKAKILALRSGTPQTLQQADAESQHLREQLRNARRELDVLRRRSRFFGEPDEALTDLDEDEGDVLRAPSSGAVPTTPTPPKTDRPQMMGVTRTESGSLIPGVSGRPTPAPSEDRPSWPQRDVTPTRHGEDLGDVFMDVHADLGAAEGGGRVLTPDLTPTREVRDQDVDRTSGLREELTNAQISLNQMMTEAEILRTELAQKDERLVSLAEKEAAIAGLQAILTARDATIAEKGNVLSEHLEALTETRTTLEERDGRIAELQRIVQDTIVEKDRAIEETVASKDATISQLQAILESVKAEATELGDKAQAFERSADAFEAELLLLREQYVDAQETARNLQTDLENAVTRAEEFEERVAEMDNVLEERNSAKQLAMEMEERIREKKLELAEKNEMMLQKDALISAINAQHRVLNAELTQALESAQGLSTRIATIEEEAAATEARLRSEVDSVQVEMQELSESLATLRSEKVAVDSQSEDFRGRVIVLARNLQTSRSEHTAAKATILDLLGTMDAVQSSRDEEVRTSAAAKEALSIVEAEAAKLREQIHETVLEIQQCRGELAVKQVALVTEQTNSSMLRSDLTVARADLEKARSVLETSEKEIEGVREGLKDAMNEAEDLRVAKQADEGTISAMKGVFERLRKAQVEWISELDEKIASALPSSMPAAC